MPDRSKRANAFCGSCAKQFRLLPIGLVRYPTRNCKRRETFHSHEDIASTGRHNFYARLLTQQPTHLSPRSFFVFQQVGGAISRVPAAATAYANRDAAYDSFPVSIWSDPAADEANIGWAREMYTVLRPFGMGGVYVNNLGDEGHERVKAAYGENYDRLVTLKRKYDPDNLFRFNQNVHP